MNHTRNRKKTIALALGAAAAAVAAPAVLFAGSGTAAATPYWFSQLDIDTPPGGATLHVWDNNVWPAGAPNVLSCTYSSKDTVTGTYYQALPFPLMQGQEADVLIWPAIPSGHPWNTHVVCVDPAAPATPVFDVPGPQITF